LKDAIQPVKQKGDLMNQKNNLQLFGLLLPIAAFLVFGCKLGNLTTKSPETSGPVNSNTTSTPTKESLIISFKDKAEELEKFSAALYLTPKSKIKGKIAIVTKSSSGYYSMDIFNEAGTDFNEKILDYYGLTKDDLALKVEEIDTLIQIVCNKGKQIGEYSLTDGSRIPAYALESEVSVIDYKAPAIFARKTFISKDLDKNIKIDSSTTERKAYFPFADIGKYIKSLRSK
jgi:hypothetical protein